MSTRIQVNERKKKPEKTHLRQAAPKFVQLFTKFPKLNDQYAGLGHS